MNETIDFADPVVGTVEWAIDRKDYSLVVLAHHQARLSFTGAVGGLPQWEDEETYDQYLVQKASSKARIVAALEPHESHTTRYFFLPTDIEEVFCAMYRHDRPRLVCHYTPNRYYWGNKWALYVTDRNNWSWSRWSNYNHHKNVTDPCAYTELDDVRGFDCPAGGYVICPPANLDIVLQAIYWSLTPLPQPPMPDIIIDTSLPSYNEVYGMWASTA